MRVSFDYKSFVIRLKNDGVVVGDEEIGYKVNPYLEMPRSLDFSDVAILQAMNKCESRLDADISSEVFRGVTLDVPLIASNMSSVVDAEFCIKLYKLGALGILHRAYMNESEYLAEVKKVAEVCSLVAASVGAGSSQIDLASRLVHAGANVINVDIAHGYSDPVIRTGLCIKKNHPDVKIIIGNTINTELMYYVADWADAVKIAIGTGSACETKNTAGCYEKPLSVALRFKEVSRNLGLPVINDGGLKEPSHFTKIIAAGCNSAMAGSIFARCPESAAEVVYLDGVPKKMYFGMASREAQVRWRGGLKPGTCPEGKTVYLDLGETAEKLLERYSGALRSGITYAGATNVREFQDKVRFVRL